MTTRAIIVLGLFVVLFLIVRWLHIKRKTEELEKERERAEREIYEPDDELYDPETGKSYTLEEFSKEGFSFGGSDLSRIPTEEEIQFLYSGDEETLKLLLRHIRTLPYEIIEIVSPSEEPLGNLLLFEAATYWNVEIAVEIRPTSRVLLVEYERVNPNHRREGYSRSTPRYTVLALHKVIPGITGHHLITSSTTMMNFINNIAGANDQLQISGFETVSIELSSDVYQIKTILSPYLNLPNIVIEIYNENLYVVINRLACIDDFDMLVRISSEFN